MTDEEKKEIEDVELSPEEQELLKGKETEEETEAEEQGGDDAGHEEQSETETEKDSEEKPKEIDLDTLDSFDAVHKLYEEDREKFWKLPKAVTAQYHNSKGLYKKVRGFEEAEKKRKELGQIQEAVQNKRIAEALKALDQEDITVEQLRGILGGEAKSDSPERPLTVAEFERIQKENQAKAQESQAKQHDIVSRQRDLESLAQSRLGSLEEVNRMADFAKKGMDAYDIEKLNSMLTSDDYNPVTAYSFVEKCAKLAGYAPGGAEKQDKPKKQRSSAMVGGGNGKARSADDLTPEDVARMSQAEFDKLPSKVREKILRAV